MKHIKLILIIICALFVTASSILIYAELSQEHESRMIVSDLTERRPATFENLKSVRC